MHNGIHHAGREKKGKNVYNAHYLYGGEIPGMRPTEYYIEGNYIFFEEPNISGSSSSSSSNVGFSYDFSPKPLTIFTSDSIRIGNAFYKKR